MRSLERDVAGVHIDHVDVEPFEFPKDRLDVGPSLPILLPLLGTPLRHDLLGEVGRLKQVGACEVQNEGPFHDGDLDDLKFVVEIQQCRQIASKNGLHFESLKVKVGIAFAGVARNRFMSLQRRHAELELAFGRKDNTVNAGAQWLQQPKLSVASAI